MSKNIEITDTAAYQADTNSRVQCPSRFQPEDRADFWLGEGHARVCAIIKKVHITKSKITYDLRLSWGDNHELQTRIYNVDSVFVVPCQIRGVDGILRDQE